MSNINTDGIFSLLASASEKITKLNIVINNISGAKLCIHSPKKIF